MATRLKAFFFCGERLKAYYVPVAGEDTLVEAVAAGEEVVAAPSP